MADQKEQVTIHVDGKAMKVPKGTSVAGALLQYSDQPFRRLPENGDPRSPHCFSGVCFECLVEIDGVPNRQGCLTPVKEGMRIRHQRKIVAPAEYPSKEV